ncbi:adhesion G-protein coupled receptor F3 [Xenopus tropicalis]|uniref:Adhesion G-protein coupled receptor F3 n=1 Tax=Xenopus tropicalis TaxID=8364 RepID=A0A8J1JL65_XENTR|nr:adhesion G-protein coupled receptor F3 [Xenopus tropicalis]
MTGGKGGSRVKRLVGQGPLAFYVQFTPQDINAVTAQVVRDFLGNFTFPSAGPEIQIINTTVTTGGFHTSRGECTRGLLDLRCMCRPGFVLNVPKCTENLLCGPIWVLSPYCLCAQWASTAAYCESPPTNPGMISLLSSTISIGSQVQLLFNSTKEVTNVRWFIKNKYWILMTELYNGAKISIETSAFNSTLTIRDSTRMWGGQYICNFIYKNLYWQVNYTVDFPLRSQDITNIPARASLMSNGFLGITLECCVWDDGQNYTVLWDPGAMSSVVLRGTWNLCYTLSITTVPAADTNFTCRFQGNVEQVAEAQISIVVIQAGDLYCPQDVFNPSWKETKAGYDAEILCPEVAEGRTRDAGNRDSPDDRDFKVLHDGKGPDFIAVCSQILEYEMPNLWYNIHYEDPAIGSKFTQSLENMLKVLEPQTKDLQIIAPNIELNVLVLESSTLASYSTLNVNPRVQMFFKSTALQELTQTGNLTMASLAINKLSKLLANNYGDSLKGSDHAIKDLILMNVFNINQDGIDVIFERASDSNKTKVDLSRCVLWDYNLFDGNGGWSAEECVTYNKDNLTVCSCSHQMSLSLVTFIPTAQEECRWKSLSLFSRSTSIASLTLSLIIYLVEWKFIVKTLISFCHQLSAVNIALCWLIADLCYLGSSCIMSTTPTPDLCIAAAFFKHLFYTAASFWMLFEGLFLFQQLVLGFLKLQKKALVVIMLAIGYLCPLIIALVTLSLYHPSGTYINADTCFLNVDNGAINTFSAPVLLISFMNIFVVIVGIWKLMKPSQSEKSEEGGEGSAKERLEESAEGSTIESAEESAKQRSEERAKERLEERSEESAEEQAKERMEERSEETIEGGDDKEDLIAIFKPLLILTTIFALTWVLQLAMSVMCGVQGFLDFISTLLNSFQVSQRRQPVST